MNSKVVIAVAALSVVVVLGVLSLRDRPSDTGLSCLPPTRIVDGFGATIGSPNDSLDQVAASVQAVTEVEFAQATYSDELLARADTLEYRACQALSNLNCRNDIACERERIEILSSATERLHAMVESRREVALSNAIDSCVAARGAGATQRLSKSTEGGARAGSPGIGGGRNTARRNICLALGPHEEYLSASTVNLTCHGGRCSVTGPRYDEATRQVCVEATAWSDSKSFGGGGSGQYRLIVDYDQIPTEEQRASFAAQCQSEVGAEFAP